MVINNFVCSQEDIVDEIFGCMDMSANNYNQDATVDNGSCYFDILSEFQIYDINLKTAGSNNKGLFNYDFLNCLERSGCTKTETGWEPNHFIIKKNQKIICIVPTFRKFNSNGEFVFDHAWADAYHRLGIKYYPKLLAGVPFTPVNGCLLYTSDAADE